MMASAQKSGFGPMVVVIEDDLTIGYLLKELLTGDGYRVECADNGEAGLALVRTAQPDVVLCDCQLPLIDGMDVARAIKADPELWSIPVILMSAGGDPHMPDLFSAFVPKPFDIGALLGLLEAETGQRA